MTTWSKPNSISGEPRRESEFLFGSGALQVRPLPNFIIVGVDKGGTTSLFYNLAEHPQIVPPVVFPHWERRFSTSAITTVAASTGIVRPPRARSRPDHRRGVGNLSLDAAAPERMHAVLPDVKLIVLLRNPIARAMSHFKHRVREDKDDLRTFNEVSIANSTGRSTIAGIRWNGLTWERAFMFSASDTGIASSTADSF